MGKMTLAEKFWPKVDLNGPEILPGSPCHLWTGACYESGHGCLGHEGKTIGAHMAAYILHYGSIPKGKHVLHKCDMRPCVRWEHLLAGTNKENVDDKMAKGRHRVMRGKDHWTYKNPDRTFHKKKSMKPKTAPRPKGPNLHLTDDVAREIVRRVTEGESAYEVGEFYGLVLSTVYRICHGKLRAGATDPEMRSRADAHIKAQHLKGRRPALSEEKVALVRARLKAGARQWQIAQELDISQALVSKIANGKSYTHV